MHDCTTSTVTGRIEDLIVRLDTDPDGRDRLLTVCPLTRRASLTLYKAGRQVGYILGRIHRGYLITDRTLPNGRRWVRIAALLTLSLWLGGCTMTVQSHWPGRLNAIDHQESAQTVYHPPGG